MPDALGSTRGGDVAPSARAQSAEAKASSLAHAQQNVVLVGHPILDRVHDGRDFRPA